MTSETPHTCIRSPTVPSYALMRTGDSPFFSGEENLAPRLIRIFAFSHLIDKLASCPPKPNDLICLYSLRPNPCFVSSLFIHSRPSRALCSPPFLFPSALHLRMAYKTRQQCAGDRAGPVYNTSHSAEACKTACATSHPHKSCAP